MIIRKTILKPVFAVLFIDLLLCLREASKKMLISKASGGGGRGHVYLLLQNENASDQQQKAFKSEIVHKLLKEKK